MTGLIEDVKIGINDESITFGILTVCDMCINGSAPNKNGENLKKLLESEKLLKGHVAAKDIVLNEASQIKTKLIHWSDHCRMDVILTTGGIGFAARDVTPEATKSVLEKEAPGMTLAMLKGTLDITPMAMLSRPACGIRGQTIIINLPGDMKESSECLSLVAAAIPHAVHQLKAPHHSVLMHHGALHAEGIKSSTCQTP